MVTDEGNTDSVNEDNSSDDREFTEIPILGVIEDLDESDKYMIDPLGDHITHGELTDGREFEIRNSMKAGQTSIVVDIANEDDDYTRTVFPLENIIDSVFEVIRESDEKELPEIIESTEKETSENEDSQTENTEDESTSREDFDTETVDSNWPENATSRDELKETQIRVIEAAIENPDVTSTGELTELAGVADKRNQYYAHDVLSTHWEERLDTT